MERFRSLLFYDVGQPSRLPSTPYLSVITTLFPIPDLFSTSINDLVRTGRPISCLVKHVDFFT